MAEKTVAVIGAGAIGGVTAAYIARAGYDVQLVSKYADKAERFRQEGVHITGVRGDQYVRLNAVADIEQLSGKKDILLIVTKAYDMTDAARRALPFLKEDSLVVSMQNGICIEALADVVGASRAAGCVVGWGSTMLPDGRLHMTSEGDFVIGGLLPGLELSLLQKVLNAVVPTRISDGIISELYSKMIVNACITSLGVLSGLYLGQIMKKRAARDIFISIIREAVAVADAMKLTIPPYGGKLDYYNLARGSSTLDNIRTHLLIRIIGFKYRRLKSSSLQSISRGRPTEVDYFNGYIAQKGALQGIPTPVNSRIVAMIKEIEAGKRNIDPANFLDSGLAVRRTAPR
jgi:2-dehydropantoate 2-reductase